MKSILLFILGIILLPIYPFLGKMRKVADKMQFSERVVVVIRKNDGKKKTLIT